MCVIGASEEGISVYMSGRGVGGAERALAHDGVCGPSEGSHGRFLILLVPVRDGGLSSDASCGNFWVAMWHKSHHLLHANVETTMSNQTVTLPQILLFFSQRFTPPLPPKETKLISTIHSLV